MRSTFVAISIAIVLGIIPFAGVDARTLVVDEAGAPLIGTAVLNHNGTPIGIVDKDGVMPEVSKDKYPLTLRCLGFEDLTIEQPTERVVMKEATYTLGGVTVVPGERPACRVICYIRETSGLMDSHDTVTVITQYMADFMLKATPKAKGFPTWDNPRILNQIIEQQSISGKVLDSSDVILLTWGNIICSVPDGNAELPDSLRGVDSGTFIQKSKKTGIDAIIYQLTSSQYSIYHDLLADYKDHRWTPPMLKLFGITMDISELWALTAYAYSDDETYDIRNFVARTYSMKILGRGKLWRAAFDSSTPVEMTSYIELYPIAIEYLTAQEAKALKKDKNATYPMTLPADR